MISWEVSLALLSVSAPITAAIIQFTPRRNVGGVTAREFRVFAASTRDALGVIRADIRELRNKLDERV
jgi:hypothetical protein